MDTNVLVPIIIAVVAIIPGVWSLINLSKKDNESQLIAVSYSTSRLSDELWAMKKTIYGLSTTTKYQMETLSEDLWKKMYDKPVIIRCSHCRSPNVITNLECIKCGAPLGD
jgi:hypothetical protein